MQGDAKPNRHRVPQSRGRVPTIMLGATPQQPPLRPRTAHSQGAGLAGPRRRVRVGAWNRGTGGSYKPATNSI